MQPEKIDLATVNISEEKLVQLRDLLPEVFHEGKINFDELRNALGDYVEEDPANERFGLRWPGKSRLQQVINTPSVGTLVPQPEESVDWDTTGNIIIEGDNLEVLKLLQKSYAGKVKMIYIDPPYNTGNDFVYPDKYARGIDTYLEFTGQKDENGQKLSTNSDTSGRYHANWLNMMYPRLYLARNLLRHDGVIFVSIDDAEVANLLALTNHVFGQESHFATLVWQSRTSVQNDVDINAQHEFVVAYARNRRVSDRRLKASNVDRWYRAEGFAAFPNPTNPDRYENPDNDPRGPWKADPFDAPNVRPNLTYAIENPTTKEEHWPPTGRCWRTEESSYQNLLHDNRIVFNKNGLGRPQLKVFYEEQKLYGETPSTWWDGAATGTATRGTKLLQSLFGRGAPFDFPKPIELIQRMLGISTQAKSKEGDIVLDFFAGSGTTGHAVMQQNADDGGNRKYILVQLPEPMDKKVLDDGTELMTIADVCRERVRRAGRKIASEHPDKGIDTGFRAYRLAPSNFSPWDGTNDGTAETKPLLTSARQASFMPQTEQLTLEQRILHAADHLSPDASDIAVLTELLLKLGEELTVPVEKITLAGKTVYNVDANLRLICLERDLTLDVIRAMAEREPGEIICLDAGFPDDQTKVNAGQIIATQARQTESAIAFKVV